MSSLGIVLVGAIVSAPIFWLLISYIDKRMIQKKSHNYVARKSRKNHLSKFYKRGYLLFDKHNFTRAYLLKIRRIYENYYPGDEELIEKKTMQVIYLLWGIILVISIVILKAYSSIIAMANLFIASIYIIGQIKDFIVSRQYRKLAEQEDTFFAGVRHRYYDTRLVDTSILEAGEESGYEMSLHAVQIERILNCPDNAGLTSEDASMRAAENYNATVSNKFLKMFLALAQNVMFYGDRMIGNTYVFIENLSDLRNEVAQELLNFIDNEYLFRALKFVAIAPIFTLYPIKNWATSFDEGMHSYYYGRLGAIIVVLLYVITIFCFVLVNNFKMDKEVYISEHKIIDFIANLPIISRYLKVDYEKHYSRYLKAQDMLEKCGSDLSVKQLKVKKYLFSVATFFVSLILLISFHYIERNDILNHVATDGIISMSSNEKDLVEEVIRDTVRNKKEELVEESGIQEIVDNMPVSNPLTKEKVKAIIEEKILKYQKEYLKWYEVLIAIVCSMIAYHIPLWLIRYRIKIMELNQEMEVIQFQNIVSMMMHMQNVTIVVMLEQMEIFSNIFKKSIQKCINSFGENDIEALKELRDSEKFGPFRQLVDNFIMADKIGIERSFEEIAMDKLNSRDRRKQEQKMSRKKRSIKAYIVAYIPLFSVLILYLIVPFVLFCYSMYLQYREGMKNM